MTQDGPTLSTYVETRLNLLTRSIEEKLGESDLRYQQRFEAQSKALEAAFLAQQMAMQTALAAAKEAVVAALAAADRAVAKAEGASEKRFEGVNEFRAALADQQRTLMPRSEVEVTIKAISERLSALKDTVDARTNERRGLTGGWGYAVGAIGFLLALWTFLASRLSL